MLVALAAAGGFALVAIALAAHSGITRYELTLAQWLHAHPWPVLIDTMRLVSWMNGIAGVGLMSAALALWFWRVRAQQWLWTLLLAIPGVMLLNAFLKRLFARPRPHFADPWTSLTSYSFPSGHVSHSTVFYGLLAAWLCMRCSRRTSRILIVVAALLMIGVVATSRLYLGAHYLTDVVAAFCEGVAWLAACHIALARRHLHDGPGGKS